MAIAGTASIAAAAKYYNKPVVVCTGLYKLSYTYPFDPESYSILAAPDPVHSFQEGKYSVLFNELLRIVHVHEGRCVVTHCIMEAS